MYKLNALQRFIRKDIAGDELHIENKLMRYFIRCKNVSASPPPFSVVVIQKKCSEDYVEPSMAAQFLNAFVKGFNVYCHPEPRAKYKGKSKCEIHIGMDWYLDIDKYQFLVENCLSDDCYKDFADYLHEWYPEYNENDILSGLNNGKAAKRKREQLAAEAEEAKRKREQLAEEEEAEEAEGEEAQSDETTDLSDWES